VGIIAKIDDIQPAFNNAHRVMWEKHSGGKILSYKESNIFPVLWWEKEYNVKIVKGYKVDAHGRECPDAWVGAEFSSEEHLTWFLLKWA
jgi:hypothetical protein